MHRFKPDFIAVVTYLLPENGGREWPIHSGYRPVIKFAGRSDVTHAENIFSDRADLQPGETAEAHITMDLADRFNQSLFEGQIFEILEPPRKVGEGFIKRIVNASLSTQIQRKFIEA